MGNLNCNRCLNGSELKQEIDLKPPSVASSIEKITLSTEPSQPKNRTAILIQSFWRMWICKKAYKQLKSLNSLSIYFPITDIKETLNHFPVGDKNVHAYQYLSGCEYVGEWKGGFRHGSGECTWLNNCSYKGNWSYGFPFGQGVFTYNDGEIFNGNWINPYANGKNRSFIDDIVQGKRDGYGNKHIVWLWFKLELTKPKKKTHKKSLKCISNTLQDIDIKIAESKDNLDKIFTPEFFCAYDEVFASGTQYVGQRTDGKRSGYGKSVWENGDVYLGHWENDMQNGWGSNVWEDGSSYIGQYVNNLKQGIGEYIWDDGTKYMGEWNLNVIHGIGKYSWQDGREYIGEWHQGLMNGFGIHKFKDGKKYEGEWKLGKKHGLGYTVTSDGLKTQDSWFEGRIQR